MSTYTRVTCAYCGDKEDVKNLASWELRTRKCKKCDHGKFRTKPLPEGNTNPFGYEIAEKEESPTLLDWGSND